MAESINSTPGSRAIKIPINVGDLTDFSTSSRRRRGNQLRNTTRLEQTDSSDTATWSPDPWSDPSPASSSTSTSFSRPRDVAGGLMHTQKSIASPSDAMTHTKGHASANTESMHGGVTHHNGGISKRSREKQKAGSTRHSTGSIPPPNVVPSRPLTQPRTDSYASYSSPLGPSMLTSCSYKSINLTSHHQDSDEPARLITYTKHSQGFTWNDELFLPSYLMGRRYGGGRRRWVGYDGDEDVDDMGDFDEEGDRCPVTDIFVTDEEAAAMMP